MRVIKVPNYTHTDRQRQLANSIRQMNKSAYESIRKDRLLDIARDLGLDVVAWSYRTMPEIRVVVSEVVEEINMTSREEGRKIYYATEFNLFPRLNEDRIKELEAEITKGAQELAANPTYRISWVDGIFEATAELEWRRNLVGWDAAEAYDHLKRYVGSLMRRTWSSSSVCSNLYEDYKRKTLGDILDKLERLPLQAVLEMELVEEEETAEATA